MSEHMSDHEPIKRIQIDAEELAGHRFPYQEDISLVEDVDLLASTPGEDINWLEDIELLQEDGVAAVFDRYSNSFLKIYFPIPEGRENEIARKVLIKHLQSGNSYGIQLKEQHAKFPQPMLGPWVEGSETVGTDYHAPTLEGWLHEIGAAFLYLYALFRMHIPPQIASQERMRMADSLRDGLRYIRGQKLILTLLIGSACVSIFGRSYITLLPVFAKEVLGLGAAGLATSPCRMMRFARRRWSGSGTADSRAAV